MSSKDCVAGNIVLEETDWSHLAGLRKDVGFQVLSRSFQRRTVWLIGTGLSTGGKRWNPVWPFIEGNPVGSPASSEQVQELARPFCAAIDALAEHNRTLPRDQWPVNPLNGQQYKPLVGRTSRQIGELSLGFELATLLGVPVFSFISDSDAGNELVCLTRRRSSTRVLSAGRWAGAGVRQPCGRCVSRTSLGPRGYREGAFGPSPA